MVLGVIIKIRPLNYVIFNVKYLNLRVSLGSSLGDHALYSSSIGRGGVKSGAGGNPNLDERFSNLDKRFLITPDSDY